MAEPTPERGTALERCIDLTPGQFASDHWGRAPLLSHTVGFTDLFDAAAVDELVAERGLRTPFLRLAANGRVLPAATFTGAGGVGARVADQADAAAILTHLADGATLVLQGLHRMWPALGRFARALTDELGHPVQVNAYITPAGAQGFASHFDTHDVFVLQIAGTKHWTIHRPVVTDPLPSQPWEQWANEVAAEAGRSPWLDRELRPGDSLYLPRGWIHSAVSGGETSIHLTVGVHPVTGADALRSLLERALTRGSPELRRSLPMGRPDVAQVVDLLRKEALAALAEIDVQDVAADLAERFQRDAPAAPVHPLAQLAAAAEVAADTQVRLRPGLVPSFAAHGDRFGAVAGSRRLEVPASWRPALETLLSGDPVAPADLSGLTPAQAGDLVRRALRETIVIPVAG